MARGILPPELQGIREGLLVGAHKSGKLLLEKVVSLSRGERGEEAAQRKLDMLTFMKNSPSSESIFTDEDASVCDILRSER